jgi:adenine/guanine phosphoribosyltransferase-like PRPP-binding protein
MPAEETVPGRASSRDRYAAARRLDGQHVLLIDDTWTAGGHAQSAAHTLVAAGADVVALAVIGRHLRRDWEVTPGETSGDLFDALPRVFDWDVCAVH